jgi:hypothetical protein
LNTKGVAAAAAAATAEEKSREEGRDFITGWDCDV